MGLRGGRNVVMGGLSAIQEGDLSFEFGGVRL
jgi:hypothetical protein